MSTETEVLLEQWGAWLRMRPPGCSVSPMLVIMGLAGGVSRRTVIEISDDVAMQVDRVVARLGQRDRELFHLIKLRYLEGLTEREIVREYALINRPVSKNTVTLRLRSALGWIAGALEFGFMHQKTVDLVDQNIYI